MSRESDAFDRYSGQDDLEPEQEPGLEPCERCGTYAVVKSVTVQVSRQTMSEPAEYEELFLCEACIEGSERERDPDEPPDADHELGNTARERDERAWEEKRSLR